MCTWARKRESEGRIHGDGKIKHHMMGAVIASETTKRIKNPLPLSLSLACFIASSSSLDGIITLFVLRKRKPGRNHSDNSPSQRVRLPLVIWMCSDTVIETCSHISIGGEDLKRRWFSFRGLSIIALPAVLKVWSWEAQLHIIISPQQILFSYIYRKHFIAQMLSLLLSCIYHRSSEKQKAKLCFPAADCQDFSSFHLS